MSLIQEALKRQEADSQQRPAAVRVPPPPPDVDENEEALVTKEPEHRQQRPKSKPWAVLLGVLAVILLLVGGAVWMLFTAVRTIADDVTESVTTAVARAEPPDAAQEPAPPEPALPSPPEPVADPGPAVAAQPEPAAPPETVAEDQPDPAGTEVDPAVAVAPPPEPAGSEPAPEADAAAEPDTPAANIQWPLLKVSGIVGKGRLGSAVVNGKIIAVGELVKGVKLVGVDGRSVDLEYEGETRSVRVGGTTEW